MPETHVVVSIVFSGLKPIPLFYIGPFVLTPWYRILFEKLIATQLIKNPNFFMEPEGSSSCLQNPPLDPILSCP
jgi:hypothetical protein